MGTQKHAGVSIVYMDQPFWRVWKFSPWCSRWCSKVTMCLCCPLALASFKINPSPPDESHNWVLGWTVWLWRWRHYDRSKRRELYSQRHGITSQRNESSTFSSQTALAGHSLLEIALVSESSPSPCHLLPCPDDRQRRFAEFDSQSTGITGQSRSA
jgi:hypothetical protein